MAISASAAIPSHDEVIARAKAVVPLLAQNAQRCEVDRSVPVANIEALREAGLFRLLVPRRVGGYELGLRTMVDTVTTVAGGCVSCAWVVMVATAHDWMVGMFPEQCQDDVYGGGPESDGPDSIVAGTLAAQGEAVAVENGWRVSGRWQFGSGVDHAPWCLAGATLTTSSPDDPKHVHVIVPRSDFRIDDTWHVLGLRGTGSQDVLLDDVFVPAHRSVSTGMLFAGRSPAAARHATRVYLTPVLPGLTLHIVSAVLGIAQVALTLFEAEIKPRAHAYTGTSKAAKVGIQLRFAEAAAEIQAAELLLADVCGQFERLTAGDTPPNDVERAWAKWQAAYAGKLCRQAVQRLFAGGGARVAYDSSPLQQAFRDLSIGANHAVIDPDDSAETFGRLTFGLPLGPEHLL